MKVITFGEIMLRLSPPNFQRFTQARSFDIVYGGSESNVAASLVNYGLNAEYVTRLPANEIGEACLKFLKGSDIGTHFIVRGEERMGTYFVEMGAIQRGSQVIYDRANSSFATIKPEMIDWKSIFADAAWFHWSGITPAISPGAAEVCLLAVKTAKEMGLTVSCDLNYREKLWKWGKLPSEVMPELTQYTDLVIGNGDAAEKCFGIKVPQPNEVTGKDQTDEALQLCKNLAKRFLNLKTIAITLRNSISASHNSWSGVLWDKGNFYKGPRYEITPIIDRFGSGDAFTGGLIYGLLSYDNPQLALNFAVAASCLKHTISGDINLVSKQEVEKLMMGDESGRVSR